MSQESHAQSISPAPVVEAENIPFGELLYRSSITDNTHISSILRKHGLKISAEIPVKVPSSLDRSCYPPPGNKKLRYCAWSQEHLKTGALLPLKPYFRSYLEYVRIAPFQLETNGFRILSALKSLYHIQNWGEPSPVEISYLLSLKRTPPRAGAEGTVGFYNLAAWPQENKLFEDVPNKPQSFKDKFFWTRALGCSHTALNRTCKWSYELFLYLHLLTNYLARANLLYTSSANTRRPQQTEALEERRQQILSLYYGKRSLKYLLEETKFKDCGLLGENESTDNGDNKYSYWRDVSVPKSYIFPLDTAPVLGLPVRAPERTQSEHEGILARILAHILSMYSPTLLASTPDQLVSCSWLTDHNFFVWANPDFIVHRHDSGLKSWQIKFSTKEHVDEYLE